MLSNPSTDPHRQAGVGRSCRTLGWSRKGIDTLWLSYTQLTQRRRKKIEKKIHMPEIARFFGIIIRMYAAKAAGRLR